MEQERQAEAAREIARAADQLIWHQSVLERGQATCATADSIRDLAAHLLAVADALGAGCGT
jgi:hypothetical protein